MSTYKTTIYGQEVEVTVIDPEEVNPAIFLTSEGFFERSGYTSFQDKDGDFHHHNGGYRTVPLFETGMGL